MTALISALDSALLNFVWQGIVVAMLLWITLAALRRRSANARYVASCAALSLLAVVPVVTGCMAYTRPVAADAAPFTIAAVAAMVGPIQTRVDWVAAAEGWMLPIWACVVLLLSIRMLWGCAKVSGLKRQGEAAEPAVLAMVERLAARIRVTRPVRVLISSLADGPSVVGPCVVGWMRPVLLLPAATVLGLSAEQLEAVLAHELAHVRRYDYLVNMVQMLIETLFFYHPVVWWISRRIREERELCCDDIAVRTCGDAVCYARALAALERMRVIAPGMMFKAALGAKDGPLMYRIERLLGVARREPVPSRLPGMVAICLGLACFAPVTNPVKAQAPVPLALAPTNAPQAPALEAPPTRASVLPAPKPAPRMIAQAIQPIAPASASASSWTPDTVMLEVSIDRNGDVNDARVVSGPMESRRAAIIRALSMHFPQDNGPATRYVTVPAFSPPLGIPNGLKRVINADEAQARLTAAYGSIAKLRAQQAEASERGAAQLQEIIDSDNHTIANMQRIISGQNALVGMTVEDIRINGYNINDEARGRLLAQLPIRLHDVLSGESMAAAIRGAKQMYPNADAYFGTLANGEVGFVVAVPMERGALPVR
jgi:beta-lactamase regulating signal transducer with metallopeptidase domain